MRERFLFLRKKIVVSHRARFRLPSSLTSVFTPLFYLCIILSQLLTLGLFFQSRRRSFIYCIWYLICPLFNTLTIPDCHLIFHINVNDHNVIFISFYKEPRRFLSFYHVAALVPSRIYFAFYFFLINVNVNA